jgi:hypothetical protein
MQHCTRKALGVLSVLAMAAWLSASARAQDYQTVAFEGDNSSETAEIKAEVSELRNRLNAASSQPAYEGNGGCGCGAVAEAGCGCDAGYGCDCCEDACGTWGGFEPCCHPTGFWGEGEVMWFRYHRADGVKVGTFRAETVEFDFEITPRITLGYVRCDGLGVRARYWEFDHDAPSQDPAGPNGFLDVDTYNIDVEVFDTFALNRNVDLEVAAGIRYNYFREHMFDDFDNDDRINRFSGWGGMVSAELRRCIGTNGAVFARARVAVLMSDKDTLNTEQTLPFMLLKDVTVGMTELAFGYQYTIPICGGGYYFVKAQAEWQNWHNFSTAFQNLDDNDTGEDFFGAPSDVGFGGFGLTVGVAR